VIDDIERVARLSGALPSEVRHALAGAQRRSEPDAREIYGVIRGYRFVARRPHVGAEWTVGLEHRPLFRERAPRTGWTG
jgi:hypothetical protein